MPDRWKSAAPLLAMPKVTFVETSAGDDGGEGTRWPLRLSTSLPDRQRQITDHAALLGHGHAGDESLVQQATRHRGSSRLSAMRRSAVAASKHREALLPRTSPPEDLKPAQATYHGRRSAFRAEGLSEGH